MEYHNVPLQDSPPSAPGATLSPPADQDDAPTTSASPSPAQSDAGPERDQTPATGQARTHNRNASSMSARIFSLDHFKGKNEPKVETRALLSEEDKEGKRRYNWRSEILLGSLAVASALAIILLFVFSDGHPLDSFKIPMGLVIAALGAITRGALAFAIGACLAQEKWNWLRRKPDSLASFQKFDEASRGPMGSIQLLYWLNIRHWATVGALVTVLLLGFDPLLQGAISYEGHLVDGHNLLPPTIPYGGRLEAGSYAPNPNSGVHGVTGKDNRTLPFEDYSSIPDLKMASAIYDGFTDAPSAVNFHCASGNCTWPPFLSLGVCSSCHDVTSLLNRTKEATTQGTVPSPSTIVLTDNYTRYSLGYVELSNADTLHEHSLSAYMVVGATSSPAKSVSFRDNDRLITALGIVEAADTYERHETWWNETAVRATECALYFCIKRFDAFVTKSDLKETETPIGTKRVRDSYGPARPIDRQKFEVMREKIGGGLIFNDGNGDLPRTDLQLELDPSDDHDRRHLNDTNLVTPATFNISQSAVGSMISFIWKELFLGDSGTGLPLIWPPYQANQGFFQSSVSQAFHTSRDLSATMQRLATGMTNWARDASASADSKNSTATMTPQEQQQNPQPQMLGTQQTWTLHIKIRWPYTSLPLATLLAGFAFVLLSIRETRSLGMVPWKGDVIATMTHALDAAARDQLRSAAREGQVRQASKTLVLNFAESNHGLELRAQQQQQRLGEQHGKAKTFPR
ncbi:hypothetical protein PG993_003935 [Apiospora rasikravindrae]|uniref:Uncharacterized protein n=1 Tax=Apiospora rasikravindrae TaxID=990691 RepID=A0ABR1U383_9PEZI